MRWALALLALIAAPLWAATPTYVDHNRTGDAAAPWSVAASLPTYAEDDILFAGIIVGASDGTLSAPAGWTAITSATGSTDAQIWWYWRRATASETDPVTWSLSAGGGGMMMVDISSWRGADSSATPFEDATLLDSTSTEDFTPDTSTVTSTGTNRLAVSLALIEDNPGWSTSPPPSGWTLDYDQQSNSGTDARTTTISIGQATSGDVTSAVFGTLNTQEYMATLTLLLCDSCPGGGPVVNPARRAITIE
jgi:hypothetical protein